MAKKIVEREANYDVRTFTLEANKLLALPPARDYLILSASVDANAISLTVGDNNGDAGSWPIGLRVRSDSYPTARVISTVAQTVTIVLTDGDLEVFDNRAIPVPIPASGTTIVDGTIVASSNTIIIPAASNPRGIVIHYARLRINLDAITSSVSTGIFGATSGDRYIHARDSSNGVGPVNIPTVAERSDLVLMVGGQDISLNCAIVGTGRCDYAVVYKAL